MSDFGITTIDGGALTIDKLNIRRADGDMSVVDGMAMSEFSAQRYEPDFSAFNDAHENGRVWNPKGQYYAAPMIAIFGKGAYSGWSNLSGYNNYTDARGDDNYTNVQAYRITQNARYLVVRYGVRTREAGIMVRVTESAATGSGLMVSRYHEYRGDDTWGGEYNFVLDLKSANSRFGRGRLFYVKATATTGDFSLSNSATRELNIRLLGVMTTDTPPVGHENLF